MHKGAIQPLYLSAPQGSLIEKGQPRMQTIPMQEQLIKYEDTRFANSKSNQQQTALLQKVQSRLAAQGASNPNSRGLPSRALLDISDSASQANNGGSSYAVSEVD